ALVLHSFPTRRSSDLTVARLDVIRAQVDVAQADNALIANERDVANVQAALNRLIRRVIGAPIAPADTLAVPPALPDPATIEQVRSEEHTSELQAQSNL